jgi:predicted RNA-binding Zn-ribbon protein involved in translation (DUF1610 family)
MVAWNRRDGMPSHVAARLNLGKRTPSLRCPFCGEAITAVYDSRGRANGTWHRMRVCVACERRFSTRETCADYDGVPTSPEGKRHAEWYARQQ